MQSRSLLHWTARLREFTPHFLAEMDLEFVFEKSPVLLHGSTTRGIDDPYSDLDCWILLPEKALVRYDQQSQTRFLQFELEGKPGHYTAESLEAFRSRICHCDFHLINEMRLAQVISGQEGPGHPIIDYARKPMSDEVVKAWFRYHYGEMRSEHRACNTPIDRGQPAAILQALTPTLQHAMRAAMVLDREPYPYSKWLHYCCAQTAVGKMVSAEVDDLIRLISEGALYQPGPERIHPINLKLKEIRTHLLHAAHERDIDGPWIEYCYLHMDESQQIIHSVQW